MNKTLKIKIYIRVYLFHIQIHEKHYIQTKEIIQLFSIRKIWEALECKQKPRNIRTIPLYGLTMTNLTSVLWCYWYSGLNFRPCECQAGTLPVSYIPSPNQCLLYDYLSCWQFYNTSLYMPLYIWFCSCFSLFPFFTCSPSVPYCTYFNLWHFPRTLKDYNP